MKIKQVDWRNPLSTNYCRCPLRFKYRRELKEVVLAEYESIMASFKNITLSIVFVLLEDVTMKEVEVQHCKFNDSRRKNSNYYLYSNQFFPMMFSMW